MGGRSDLQELRALLAEAPLPLTRVLLFGSRARGEALEESDWDLLVVSPAFRGMDYLSRVQLLQGCLPLRNVDYVALTPEEWEARKGEIGLVGEAAREGLVLLDEGMPAG
ncbi:putative nucleotidyltransferase [Thermus thermophilus]|uniref:nucleotidyltransferase domain-containing protein n=1 Tax=Thermus thermophilus TaxID=274 RepID=UPI000909CC9B|nr:nucleotidyltransferase domain-containing protein [Thermus thermophilus]BAW02138.1 putative nucleotidyltransferase [Thermus thermophilus]BDB10398.1 nucleotidyltransferase [Thermus thermophilus]